MHNKKTWSLLIFAIIFEIAWASGLKFTDDFTLLIPSLMVAVLLILSVYILGLVVRVMPVGTAYAIWTGCGTLGISLIGIIFFNNPIDIGKAIAILLIITGIVGLKYFAHTGENQ